MRRDLHALRMPLCFPPTRAEPVSSKPDRVEGRCSRVIYESIGQNGTSDDSRWPRSGPVTGLTTMAARRSSERGTAAGPVRLDLRGFEDLTMTFRHGPATWTVTRLG